MKLCPHPYRWINNAGDHMGLQTQMGSTANSSGRPPRVFPVEEQATIQGAPTTCILLSRCASRSHAFHRMH